MKQECSRRDFLKIAGTGLGTLVFGGFLSACGEEKTAECADPKRTGTLNPGDYMLAGEYKIKLDSIILIKGYPGSDFAYFNITKGGAYAGGGRIQIGQSLPFDYDQEKREYKRVFFRCEQNEYAVWELKDVPDTAPTLTPAPAAVFP